MKTTLERLDHSVDSLRSMIATCKTSRNKKELLAALSKSNSDLVALLDHMREKERYNYVKVRKALTTVRNVVSSLCDGLNDDMSPQDFREATTRLTEEFFPLVRASLEDELAKTAQPAVDDDTPLRTISTPENVISRIKIVLSKSASSDTKAALQVITTSNSQGVVSISSSKESELEALYRTTRELLPISLATNFTTVRAPIIPLIPSTTAIINKLKTSGFKAETMSGITVLKDQILLIVSTTKAAESNVSPTAFAQSVLELMNERSAEKYELVSDSWVNNPRLGPAPATRRQHAEKIAQLKKEAIAAKQAEAAYKKAVALAKKKGLKAPPPPKTRVTDPTKPSVQRGRGQAIFWVLPRRKMSALMSILPNFTTQTKWGLPVPPATANEDAAIVRKRDAAAQALEKERLLVLTELANKRAAAKEARDLERLRSKEKRSNAQRDANAEKRKRLEEQKQRMEQRAKKVDANLQKGVQLLADKFKPVRPKR